MNRLKRIYLWKNTITKTASDATHRAVSHRDPVDPPASDVETRDGASVLAIGSRDVQFARTFWMTGLIVGIIVLVVWKVFDLLLLILISYLLSVGLEGPIRFFQRGIRYRGLSLFLVYFLLVVLCLSMLLIIPFIGQQLIDMVQTIIKVINGVSVTISTHGFEYFVEHTTYIPSWFKDNILDMAEHQEFVTSVKNFLVNLNQTITNYVSGGLATDSFSILTSFFGSSFMAGWKVSLVLVLSVFFSIEYKSVFVFLVKFAPVDYRSYIYKKMLIIYDKMQLWLKGQLFLMAYIFVVVLLGLWLIRLLGYDIPQIGLLALIAGLTEILPYIGPFIGAVPAIILAFTTGGRMAALIVMCMFVFIQWTENNIVVPVVMNKVLGVRSLIIFITMLAATWMFGLIGVIMAVPLAVIITTFWGKGPYHTQELSPKQNQSRPLDDLDADGE